MLHAQHSPPALHLDILGHKLKVELPTLHGRHRASVKQFACTTFTLLILETRVVCAKESGGRI